MNINLYQIQYDENTAAKDASGLLTFDCRENPEFLKREIAHLIRFYDEVVVHANNDDYFGLFSPKFTEKTKLSIFDVKAFIEQNIGQNIYLFNPFPMLVYKHLNMWEQGEAGHMGLQQITNQLFHQARIDFNVDSLHRQNHKQVVYCNYWVANKLTFDKVMPLIKQLDLLCETDVEIREKILSHTHYTGGEACFYPFVFERILSTFLYLNKNIKVLPYEYDSSHIAITSMKKLEKKFYQSSLRAEFRDWELAGNKSVEEIKLKIDLISNYMYPQSKSKSKAMKSALKVLNLFKFNQLKKALKLSNHD